MKIIIRKRSKEEGKTKKKKERKGLLFSLYIIITVVTAFY